MQSNACTHNSRNLKCMHAYARMHILCGYMLCTNTRKCKRIMHLMRGRVMSLNVFGSRRFIRKLSGCTTCANFVRLGRLQLHPHVHVAKECAWLQSSITSQYKLARHIITLICTQCSKSCPVNGQFPDNYCTCTKVKLNSYNVRTKTIANDRRRIAINQHPSSEEMLSKQANGQKSG